MPRRITAKDILYRDPLDSFTDREEILELFKQFLQSAQPGQLRSLAIKGMSGTGKTFLISYLIDRICPKLRWQSGKLSFAQLRVDFRSILDGLEDALKGCVQREYLIDYRSLRKEYNDSFNQYRASITINASIEAKDHSSITGVSQNIQVNAQLREREMQLRAELTRALVELVEKSELPLCVFIDNYERLSETDPELVGWLWEEILPRLAKASPQSMLIVTCGWEHPRSPAITPLLHPEELTDFDPLQIRSYLEKQHVIIPDASLPSSEQEELVSAFYDLTKGHPLVLGLAVTYFNQLDIHERKSQILRIKRPFVDDSAQIEFLQERLLSRLPEPHRTLLERGPVLRYFDQSALQAILSVEIQGSTTYADKLDDRAYERFRMYPFINRVSKLDSGSLNVRPTFHDLVRRVQLEALRRHHPETKAQLHRKMAEILDPGIRVVNVEQEQEETRPKPSTENSSSGDLTGVDDDKSTGEIPDEKFRGMLEYFYHALQVTELQSLAFKVWEALTARAVAKWQRLQARVMLEVVQQVAEEGDPFLSKNSDRYGRYLIYYSKFLELEVRWEEAQTALEEAALIFEQVGNRADFASSLNNLGLIFQTQGNLVQALGYHERALTLREKVGDPAGITQSLNNIGYVYSDQGNLVQALGYHERALTLREKVGDRADIAQSLNNIGKVYYHQGNLAQALNSYRRAITFEEYLRDPSVIALYLNNLGLTYLKLGKTEEALSHFQRALTIGEQLGALQVIGLSLHNLGLLYMDQGKAEEALSYYRRALAINEQVGNPTAVTATLINIGDIYRKQGKGEEALNYYKGALILEEEVGNPNVIASCLNKVGDVYREQGEREEALNYYKQALTFEEQGDNPIDLASTLNNIGTIYYSQGEGEGALSYFKLALTFFEQGNSPANRATCHHNMGTIYASLRKVEEALNHHEQALILYEQESMLVDLAESLNEIGDIYRKQGKGEEALNYYKRALSLREQLGNPIEIAVALNNIGCIYYDLGKLEEALGYHERALTLREKVGDPAAIIDSLHNIGAIYDSEGKLEEALGYYKQALSLCEQEGNPADIAQSLNNMGEFYRDQGEFEQALYYQERALALKEQIGNPIAIALAYHNIGLIYGEQEEWKQAAVMFIKALDLYEALGQGFEIDVADELEMLAICHSQWGEIQKARYYYAYAQQLRAVIQKPPDR